MASENWWVIKMFFGSIAALLTFASSVLLFIDIWKFKHQLQIRNWFHQKWDCINNSRLLILSEKTIRWILSVNDHALRFFQKFCNKSRSWGAIATIVFLVIALPIECLVFWGKLIAGIFVIACVILILFHALVLVKFEKDGFFTIMFIVELFLAAVVAFVWPIVMLKVPLEYALLGTVGLTPFSFFVILSPIAAISIFYVHMMAFTEGFSNAILGRRDPHPEPEPPPVDWYHIAYVSAILTLSFFVTFIAMFLGNIVVPKAWIPQIWQVLASNLLFDGLTLFATFKILRWSVKKAGLMRIPVAVLFDVVLAAVFACAALYLGVFFSDYRLSLVQILRVLFGLKTDGLGFEFGPFFWTMHTTFIPTVLYLSLICVTWLGKLLLVPVKYFLGEARKHEYPLRLTAALLGIIVALCSGLAFAAGAMQERAKEVPPTNEKQRGYVLDVNYVGIALF